MCLLESFCKQEVNPVASVEEDGDGGEDDQRPLVNLIIITGLTMVIIFTGIMEGHLVLLFSADHTLGHKLYIGEPSGTQFFLLQLLV